MPAKNHLTMAARRDSRIRREGAKKGWHIHYDCTVTQWIVQKTKKGGLQDRRKPGQCSGTYYRVDRRVPQQDDGSRRSQCSQIFFG